MKNVHFKEEQRYNSKYLLILLGAISLVVAAVGLRELLSPVPNYANVTFLFTAAIIIGGLTVWYNQLWMKVTICDKKIKFKMSPLPVRKHSLKWKEIEKCAIVKTPEAAQWSGGNITFNHEKRYSLNGRNGLAIQTKRGERYFIGCRDVAALREALRKVKTQVG